MVNDVINQSKLEDFAQRYVKENSGLRTRTGELINKTKAKVIRTRGGHLIKIQNSAKHAWAQDQGSGLYGRRRAKYMIAGNPYLRFIWKGQTMYRRYVMHPGVRPTRFLYNTTDATARTVASWLESGMKRVAAKF